MMGPNVNWGIEMIFRLKCGGDHRTQHVVRMIVTTMANHEFHDRLKSLMLLYPRREAPSIQMMQDAGGQGGEKRKGIRLNLAINIVINTFQWGKIWPRSQFSNEIETT